MLGSACKGLRGLESIRIHFLPILEEIEKCQNWKVSEPVSVRIRKCQNWKVSELKNIRIGKSEFSDSFNMGQMMLM